MSAERKKPTILVVDDELGPRESLRMVLKHEYDLTSVDRADDGIRIIRENPPDLVILDIRMPDKNGIEALKEIRQFDREVSVVMLTGFSTLATAQQAMRLGANDYVSKPFDMNEIREMARRYTRRSKLERKRATMLGELRDLNKQLSADLAASKQLASIGRSSSEIAHDMRNPLTIVSGYLDLLAAKIGKHVGNGDTDDEIAEYLEVIGENVKRCCELAHMWSRIGADEIGQHQPLPLHAVLTDVQKGVTPIAEVAGATVVYECDEGIWVKGRLAQLSRALYNIVTNSIHACEAQKGHVHVSTGRTDGRVFVRVRDNGCGMDEDVAQRIFEPYFSTKPDDQGTGLGMVIVKKVVEDHAGEVEVASKPGDGTTITLLLPALES